MSQVRLTKFGHACIRLDSDTAGVGSVVVDPGSFTDVPRALLGAKYVFVTHNHADHLDVGAVTKALHDDGELLLFGNNQVVATLLGANVPRDQVFQIAAGRKIAVNQGTGQAVVTPWDGWGVVIGGGWHAPIHSGLPRVRNVTLLFTEDGGTVYHPGDSLDLPNLDSATLGQDGGSTPGILDVLCVPVSGPWLRLADAIDFIHDAEPRIVIPIHDGNNSEPGNQLAQMRLSDTALAGPIEYRRLAPGESIAIS